MLTHRLQPKNSFESLRVSNSSCSNFDKPKMTVHHRVADCGDTAVESLRASSLESSSSSFNSSFCTNSQKSATVEKNQQGASHFKKVAAPAKISFFKKNAIKAQLDQMKALRKQREDEDSDSSLESFKNDRERSPSTPSVKPKRSIFLNDMINTPTKGAEPELAILTPQSRQFSEITPQANFNFEMP